MWHCLLLRVADIDILTQDKKVLSQEYRKIYAYIYNIDISPALDSRTPWLSGALLDDNVLADIVSASKSTSPGTISDLFQHVRPFEGPPYKKYRKRNEAEFDEEELS